MTFFKKIFGFGKTIEPKVSAPQVSPSTVQIGASKFAVSDKISIEPVLREIEPITADIADSQSMVDEIEVGEPSVTDVLATDLPLTDGAEFGVVELIAAEPMPSPIPAENSPVSSESVFENFDQVIHYPSAFDLREKRIKLKIQKNKKTAPKRKYRKIPG